MSWIFWFLFSFFEECGRGVGGGGEDRERGREAEEKGRRELFVYK